MILFVLNISKNSTNDDRNSNSNTLRRNKNSYSIPFFKKVNRRSLYTEFLRAHLTPYFDFVLMINFRNHTQSHSIEYFGNYKDFKINY